MNTIAGALIAGLIAFPAASTLRLETVRTYGWGELAEAPRSLTQVERLAGGAVLGHVTDAVEGQGGRVYVLDGSNKKVVVFAADGAYVKLFGREGRGPGEFVRPTRITTTAAGSVYVFDRALGRLSEFSSEGEYKRQITLSDPNIADLTISDTIVWTTRVLIGSGPAHMRAYRLRDGTAVEEVSGLTADEIDLSSTGAVGRLLPFGRSGVLLVGPMPVIWRQYSKGRVQQFGGLLFKDVQAVALSTNGRTRIATASVRGAANASGNRLIISYRHLKSAPKSGAVPEYIEWLSVWTPTGKELARLDVTHQQLRVLGTARNGDVFLVGDTEYPQLLRMRVVID